MTKADSKLEQHILTEIQKLKKQSPPPGSAQNTQILGAFLEAALHNLHISKSQFASKIDAEDELVDGLLEGLIPAAEIEDEWLVMMAQAIQTQPNMLRIILARAIVPAVDESDEASSV